MPAWCQWIWRAWHRLSADRAWIGGGFGAPAPGRIPWTAIAAWCRHHDIGADDQELLEAGLDAMDDEYIAWHAERARQEAVHRRR